MIKELKITDRKLQDVGLRPLITAIMMEHGFEKGFVKNNDNGSVSVFADAAPERLKELRDALLHGIKKESEKEYSEISKDFRVSEWANPNPHTIGLMILSNNFNDMLSLRQITKGASVMQKGFKDIVDAIENLPEKIANAIKGA
jgi:acylphosphatase